MTRTQGITVIAHNTQKAKNVYRKSKPYSYKWTIKYQGASLPQIRALLTISGFCYQDMEYDVFVSYCVANEWIFWLVSWSCLVLELAYMHIGLMKESILYKSSCGNSCLPIERHPYITFVLVCLSACTLVHKMVSLFWSILEMYGMMMLLTTLVDEGGEHVALFETNHFKWYI